MALDNITVERIKLMHPILRNQLLEDYTYVNEKLLGKGVRLRFAYTYRSPEEQAELFKKRPKVTNANSWQSIHNYGLAFDIVLLYDNNKDGTFEEASWDMVRDGDNDKIADWMEVVNYFKSKDWEWGGDWMSFKDGPHLEKNFGHTWKTLKQKIDTKNYKEEIVQGRKIKYPNV